MLATVALVVQSVVSPGLSEQVTVGLGLALGGGFYSPESILSSAVGIAFGVAMFPQVNQRFFVGKSEAVLKRSFALWPVLVLLLFVPAFLLGSWAAGLGVSMPESGNILPALLAEYTPAWFAALVVAGAMAAMMSSSDSMLLSGSSYFTRDLYRPFIDAAASERREDLVARAGVVVFASATYVASLYNPATLFTIGDTAFGGFAQLALPVVVALYWAGTTRSGILAGILGSQAFYLLSVFQLAFTVPEVFGVGGWDLVLVPGSYFGGWGANVVGMVLGLVLTVGVSLATSAAPGEDNTVYRVGAD